MKFQLKDGHLYKGSILHIEHFYDFTPAVPDEDTWAEFWYAFFSDSSRVDLTHFITLHGYHTLHADIVHGVWSDPMDKKVYQSFQNFNNALAFLHFIFLHYPNFFDPRMHEEDFDALFDTLRNHCERWGNSWVSTLHAYHDAYAIALLHYPERYILPSEFIASYTTHE